MTQGKLRLKREVALPVSQLAHSLPVVDVWVDSGVAHLDHTFSYLVPESLADIVATGSVVSVPFHGREVQGLVRARHGVMQSELKFILKALSPFPLISQSGLEIIEKACSKWVAHPWDFLRTAIPARSITVEKSFVHLAPITSVAPSHSPQISYLQLPPYNSKIKLLLSRIKGHSKSGGVLVVVPDVKSLVLLSEQLLEAGIHHVRLDSSLSRSDLYRNFLEVIVGSHRIVIGTRSAIFTHVPHLKQIILLDESSEHFYERRAPYWNVRDIALLRSSHERVNLEFIGYAPSYEVSQLIDSGLVTYRAASKKTHVQVIEQSHAELIPSRAISIIRNALVEGPVLFLAPAKGYSQSIRCSKCKSVSHCYCGGVLHKKSLSSPISCAHCLKEFHQWRCAWCHSQTPAMYARGIDRFSQEVGLVFPKVKISQFTADDSAASAPTDGCVLATPGAAPVVSSGYSAIVILEGNRFLHQSDLRSSERVRNQYFEHAALARPKSPILLIQDSGHILANSLMTWNPSIAIHKELEEMSSLSLPPLRTAIAITLPTIEITRVKKAFEDSIGRTLPGTVKVFGPHRVNEESSRILLTSIREEEEPLTLVVHEFLRKRSMAKKILPKIEVNPYSLSL